MSRTTRLEKVDYLAQKRLEGHYVKKMPGTGLFGSLDNLSVDMNAVGGLSRAFAEVDLEQLKRQQEALEGHRSELERMPDDELEEDYLEVLEAEQARNEARRLADEERRRIEEEDVEEQQQPYNQQETDAETDYWASMPTWTLDEAAILSLGKDPRDISWEIVQERLGHSEFVGELADRRERISRGQAVGQLKDPTVPNAFLIWADHFSWDLPDGIFEAVAEYHGKETGRRRKIGNLARQHGDEGSEDARHVKEQRSDAKIILAIATAKFQFNPVSRTSAARNIADCCVRQGMRIDEDTVRARLANALEILED